MSMLISYPDFLNEFNRQDKDFINNLSDYFTLSIEYELVCDIELDDEPVLETDDDVNRALGYVKDQTLLDMSRGKLGYKFDDSYKFTRKRLEENERRMFSENETSKMGKLKLRKLHQQYTTWSWVNFFIDWILSKVDPDDDEITDKRINKEYDNHVDDYIVSIILKNLDNFIFNQNMGWLIDTLEEKMPNFYKKWGHTFKYELEGDVDKKRILEFSSKTYLRGLNECFEQIDDFYQEFENQDVWKMDMKRTALHINIGVTEDLKWNPLKGLVLMGDMNREHKTPFVFSNIMWRLNNRFTQSLLDGIRRNLTGEINRDYETRDKEALWNLGFRHKDRLATHKYHIQQNIDKLDMHNVPEVENFLNPYLIKANKDFYIKEFGIKLVELESSPGYVEFRYVGGEVDKDLFKDKILYFCYIIYLMTNDDYKKKDYYKRLYKYVEDIKSIVNESNFNKFESIRWYNNGKLSPREESDINDIVFQLGDRIRLIDRKDALWDEDMKKFKNTNMDIGTTRVIGRCYASGSSIKEIEGFSCLYIKDQGWYKIDCFEKIINN